MDDEASLPYAGTEGFAGSETSRERAYREALDGTASKRQRFLLILAQRAQERGITVAEVRDASLHHGRVSGALSVLHKAGKLSRLTERRGRCAIYVMPDYVNGRDTAKHGVVHKADKETLDAARIADAFITRNEDASALFDIEPEEWMTAVRRLIDYAQGKV